MQKRVVSYHEYGVLIDALTKKLKDVNIDYIYGIPRGGLPIAIHLSHHLDVEMIMEKSSLIWEYPKKTVLLVDDIVDTGKTVGYLKHIITEKTIIKTAALFKRPDIKDLDFCVESTPNWIVFPYETYEEEPSEYHQEVYSDFFCEGK